MCAPADALRTSNARRTGQPRPLPRTPANYSADQDLDHDGVALAISEAVTNVVMHAYRDREPGAVCIFASVVEGALVVVISDDGLGMTPRTDSPGIGLGLSLISQLATTVEIDGDEDGTRMVLSFEHAA